MKSDLATRVSRKLMWRIIPFVMVLYFVSFLDRVNVGFAALTMNKAIGLSPTAFGLGGGLFFVGYFLCEVPSNLILHRVGARLWIARVMISWGIVSALSAFVGGPASFYVMRFLLGVAEAGFFPGIILYLTLWFPVRQRAVAAALLGFVVLKFLTDAPADAKWLAADERAWLIDKLKAEAMARQSDDGHYTGALAALKSPRVLALALIYFGTSAGLYTLGLWVPLMIHEFGFTPLQTGLLTGVPSVVAVIAMIYWARHSDRSGERTWHVILPCLLACAGFIFAGQASTALLVVLALVIVNVGISSAKAPLWAMPSAFLSGAGAAAGIAMINSVGNLGGFLGPFAIGWLKSYTGGYAAGLYVVAATLALSAIVTLLLSRKVGAVAVVGHPRHGH